MQYWSDQAVTGLSEAQGLMEDLLQRQEVGDDEENLFYAHFDPRLQDVDDDYEDDVDEDEDLDEDDDEDDLIDEDDFDDEDDDEDEEE